MNAIVELMKIAEVEKGVLKTITLQIVLGLGIQHESVIQLVRSYTSGFSEFGLVTYAMRPSLQGVQAGGDTQHVAFNEQYATLHLSYMRNSPKVRDFKKTLVKAFLRRGHFCKLMTLL